MEQNLFDPYIVYEREKKKLRNLPPEEYQEEVKALAERLEI